MKNSQNSLEFAIGVDVGGTKVAAGLVDRHGVIQEHTRVPMNPSGTPAQGLAAVTAAIDRLLQSAPYAPGAAKRIGICAPGPLDPRAGIILNPPNVPCWRDFPLAAEISCRYGGSVKIENDANAAALAEGLWGAGRGYQNVFSKVRSVDVAREAALKLSPPGPPLPTGQEPSCHPDPKLLPKYSTWPAVTKTRFPARLSVWLLSRGTSWRAKSCRVPSITWQFGSAILSTSSNQTWSSWVGASLQC
jgi:hypothetical protein